MGGPLSGSPPEASTAFGGVESTAARSRKRDTASQRCDAQINFRLAPDARFFGMRPAFFFGLIIGASLTQDFQNYDFLSVSGPIQEISILGASTPQRWIAGGTLEVRLPPHLSVEADANK